MSRNQNRLVPSEIHAPYLVIHDRMSFNMTPYFKRFKATERYPDLEDAIEELKILFYGKGQSDLVKKIQRCYDDWGIESQAK